MNKSCKPREADEKDPVAYLKYLKLKLEIQGRLLDYFWASLGLAGGETTQRLRKALVGVSEYRL